MTPAILFLGWEAGWLAVAILFYVIHERLLFIQMYYSLAMAILRESNE